MVASWQNAQVMCFDINNTVCEKDGIDEVVAFCEASEAVVAWTVKSAHLSHSMR